LVQWSGLAALIGAEPEHHPTRSLVQDEIIASDHVNPTTVDRRFDSRSQRVVEAQA
jgi:hypothetical protein